MALTAPSGRREANKIRTREAVVSALFTLLATEPLDQLTAERVADAAGISRRTFFNYFPSVEAVMVYRDQQVLDLLGAKLAARPIDEPLMDSLNSVIDELFTVELLVAVSHTWRAIECSAAANRFALEALHEVLTDLGRTWAADRLTAARGCAPDELELAVVTAICMAAFDAAKRHWLTTFTGPIDEAARQRFVAMVHRAFEYARPGVERLVVRPD